METSFQRDDTTFTRKDLLALLYGTAGANDQIAHKLERALSDALETVVEEGGIDATDTDLESLFKEQPGDFWFSVPNHLYVALRGCIEQGEKLRVFDYRIEPWSRESIAAHYELDRLVDALKRRGVKPIPQEATSAVEEGGNG